MDEVQEEKQIGRWRRWLRRGIFACVGCVVVIIVGLNLFVQAPEFRGWLNGLLAKQMGLPVEWEKIYYTPWRGIVLTDPRVLAVEGARETGGDSLLKAKALVIRPKWGALLRGNRRVRSFRLFDLEVVLVKDQEGRLMVPWAEGMEDGDGVDEGVELRSVESHSKTLPSAPQAYLANVPGMVGIENGQLRILEEGTGRSLLEVKGLNLELPGPRGRAGRLTVERIGVGGTEDVRTEWVVNQLDVPIEWRNGVVELRPAGMDIGGGRFEWRMYFQPWLEDLPVEGWFRVMEVDAAEMWDPVVAEFDGPLFSGRISAEGAIRGYLNRLGQWSADGRLRGQNICMHYGAGTWREFLELMDAGPPDEEFIFERVKVVWRADRGGLDVLEMEIAGPGTVVQGQVLIGFDHRISGEIYYGLPLGLEESMARFQSRLPGELRFDFSDRIDFETSAGLMVELPARKVGVDGVLPVPDFAPWEDRESAGLREWIRIWAEAVEADEEVLPEEEEETPRSGLDGEGERGMERPVVDPGVGIGVDLDVGESPLVPD